MGFFLDLIETDWVCLIVLIALGQAANICGFLDDFLVFLLSFGVSKIIDIHRKVLDQKYAQIFMHYWRSFCSDHDL
jgi:hypothetical protein